MDETTIDGKLRFIVTDLVDRKPIDMLIDREKRLFLITFKHRNDPVEVVAMICRKAKNVVYEVYPNALDIDKSSRCPHGK